MNLKKESSIPLDEEQHSIYILQSLENCDWFRQDREDENQIRLFYTNQEGALVPSQKHFSVKDFLTAVDFYQKNRDSDLLVNLATQQPDGIVNVWTGADNERKVAISIQIYRVTQILEFAYLLLRKSQ